MQLSQKFGILGVYISDNLTTLPVPSATWKPEIEAAF